MQMADTKIQINLRMVRKKAGLSLAQAAELTGVSKAMLGQIERGESSPTIATLWKLAKGFHLPLTAFIEDLVQTTDTFTPAHEGHRLFPEGIDIRTVFPFDPVYGTETFLLTLEPGRTHISQAHDTGVVEDVFVTSGNMEVLLDTDWRPLGCGGGIRFRVDRPHGYRNLSDEPAQFHNTMHYPRTAFPDGASLTCSSHRHSAQFAEGRPDG